VSTPNEEIVRRGIEAYNRGDLESTLGLFHPEVLLHVPAAPGAAITGTTD